MKTCNKCNTTYPDNMRFCKKCGGVLINNSSTINSENSNTAESKQSYNKMNDSRSSAKSNGLSKSIFLIIGIISTAVILIAVYFIFLSDGTSEELEAANKCLLVSNENIKKKTELTYSQFDKQMMINRAKTLPYFEKANKAKALSKELVDYIEKLKVEVIHKESNIPLEECKTVDLRQVAARDKYNEGTRYFIGDSPTGAGGRAAELKGKIEAYKTAMLNLLDEKYKKQIKLGLDTKGPYKDASGNERNWEIHHFYHTILAANVVILNKLIGEVKNAEFDVVNALLNSVSGEYFF